MIRDVKIKAVLNGWIVEIGCQKLVFMNKEHMLSEISKYLDDPEGTEEEYREHAVNAKHTLGDGLVAIEEGGSLTIRQDGAGEIHY